MHLLVLLLVLEQRGGIADGGAVAGPSLLHCSCCSSSPLHDCPEEGQEAMVRVGLDEAGEWVGDRACRIKPHPQGLLTLPQLLPQPERPATRLSRWRPG